MKYLKMIGFVLAFAGVMFGLTAMHFGSLTFWGPKFEQTRREIYKQSEAHVSGITRDLYDLQREYVKAESDTERQMLAGVIRHRSAEIDLQVLPADLRSFVEQVR